VIGPMQPPKKASWLLTPDRDPLKLQVSGELEEFPQVHAVTSNGVFQPLSFHKTPLRHRVASLSVSNVDAILVPIAKSAVQRPCRQLQCQFNW